MTRVLRTNMRAAASFLFVALVISSLHATTYVVPSDERLIAAADAIVTGRVLGVGVRKTEDGMIETVTELAVDEWIKGDGSTSAAIVLPGGRIGDEGLSIPGVPSFSAGERVLLFLDRNGRGEWTTWGFALGAFRLGEPGVLLRAEEVFGWDAAGTRHVERVRRHREFVDYVRATVRGGDTPADYFVDRPVRPAARVQPNATFPAGSYSLRENGSPKRWDLDAEGLQVEWRLSGNPGDLDLAQAIDSGIAAWNAANPLIHYARSPVPASGNRVANDSESRVIANDPHGDVPDGVTAYTKVHYRGKHWFQNQEFLTVSNADIVIKEGVTSATVPQAAFNDLMAHELGHSLGLRHADKTGAEPEEGPCGGDANCCFNDNDGGNCQSIMHTPVYSKSVQDWDRDALACLYEGACTAACIEPVFLAPPASRVIYEGGAALVLSASVRATPPLTAQWYIGLSGDTSTPFRSNVWSMRLRPEATIDYWVRVTGACGSVDSPTMAITVVRCPDVAITSASATILGFGQVRLRATVGSGSAYFYRWFRRDAPGGPPTLISTAPELAAQYVEGATYFVEVENECGNSATSAEVTPSETPPPVRRRRSRP